jgi:hypothetical protein
VAFEDYYEAFYIGDNLDVIVKRTPVFNTKEIAAIIPEPLRTFRFTYVNAEKPRTSQILGIYGLLDELNAYYHGTKTVIDLYSYYRDKINSGTDCWIAFMDEVNAVYFAYPEFKFFIFKYVQYAKSNYPKQYQEIIKNKELINAFGAIDKNFAQLIDEYFKLKEEIYESLRRDGFTVTETDRYCQITRGEPPYYRSTSNYLQSYKLLQNELQKEEYATLLKE